MHKDKPADILIEYDSWTNEARQKTHQLLRELLPAEQADPGEGRRAERRAELVAERMKELGHEPITCVHAPAEGLEVHECRVRTDSGVTVAVRAPTQDQAVAQAALFALG